MLKISNFLTLDVEVNVETLIIELDTRWNAKSIKKLNDFQRN